MTPLYAVQYALQGVAGDATFFVTRQLSEREWNTLVSHQINVRFPERNVVSKFTSKDAALSAAGQVPREGAEWIRVVHYGYKERGFRTGEVKQEPVEVWRAPKAEQEPVEQEPAELWRAPAAAPAHLPTPALAADVEPEPVEGSPTLVGVNLDATQGIDLDAQIATPDSLPVGTEPEPDAEPEVAEEPAAGPTMLSRRQRAEARRKAAL